MKTKMWDKTEKSTRLTTDLKEWRSYNHSTSKWLVAGTGIDLAKIVEGNQNIGKKNVTVADERSIGASQLLGSTCPACPPSL